MANAPPAAAAVTLREATSGDLADVATLLSLRDGQQRDPAVVSHYLAGLEPDSARAWLAYVDGEPAGITALYLRRMTWPMAGAENAALDSVVAGYWAHLYVRPEFRAKMIYPQLVLAMIRGMAKAGINVIFTATRQPAVAEAHQKLGFALVGKIPLQLHPLRPFRLLAKQRQHGWLEGLSGALDAAYWLMARPRRRTAAVERVGLDSGLVEQIVAWLNERLPSGVRQMWTVDGFRRRYSTTLDGTAYRITAVRRGDRVTAALVTTLAERGNRIRAGILLELATAADASAAEVRALVGEAHHYARAHGAEIMLALPETLRAPGSSRPAGRYLARKTEQYHLLVYPKTMAQPPYGSAEFAQWRFAFGDHDAF